MRQRGARCPGAISPIGRQFRQRTRSCLGGLLGAIWPSQLSRAIASSRTQCLQTIMHDWPLGTIRDCTGACEAIWERVESPGVWNWMARIGETGLDALADADTETACIQGSSTMHSEYMVSYGSAWDADLLVLTAVLLWRFCLHPSCCPAILSSPTLPRKTSRRSSFTMRQPASGGGRSG